MYKTKAESEKSFYSVELPLYLLQERTTKPETEAFQPQSQDKPKVDGYQHPSTSRAAWRRFWSI